MKKTIAITFFATALVSLIALPVMADPDISGVIEALTCPGGSPGSIKVLGVTVGLTGHTEFKDNECSDLKIGDFVKVGCDDDVTCGTADRIDWNPPVRAESSVASAVCPPPA